MCEADISVSHFFLIHVQKKRKIFGGCDYLLYFCIANENCGLLEV